MLGADGGSELVKPQHEVLDLARVRLSDVVGRQAGVERPRPINRQESLEGIGRDPFSPVGAADPVGHLALAGVAPGPYGSGDVVVDVDDSGEHRLVGS